MNPTHAQRLESDFDLVYVGLEGKVIMIEGSATELPEDEFVKALEFAQQQVQIIIDAQKELAAKAGKPKREVNLMLVRDELLEVAYAVAGDRIESCIYSPSKVER